MVAYNDDIQVVTKSLILKTLQPFFFSPLYFPSLTRFSLSFTLYLTIASTNLSRRHWSSLLCCRLSLSCRRWHQSQRFSSPIVGGASVRRSLATLQLADRSRRFISHHPSTLQFAPSGDPLPPTPNRRPFASHHNRRRFSSCNGYFFFSFELIFLLIFW